MSLPQAMYQKILIVVLSLLFISCGGGGSSTDATQQEILNPSDRVGEGQRVLIQSNSAAGNKLLVVYENGGGIV